MDFLKSISRIVKKTISVLESPIAAALATLLVITAVSFLNQNWWANLLKIVSSYLLADIAARFTIELSSGYIKILPKVKTDFNSKGHGYLVYFWFIVAATFFAGLMSREYVREFLLRDIPIEYRLGINLLFVIVIFADLELQFSR